MSENAVDKLCTLAANHRWTWHAATRELLESLPGAAQSRHPVATIDELTAGELESWLDRWGDAVQQLHAEVEKLTHAVSDPAIAYFSPEFGIAAQVPQYSGGLGILAGDHLKAASDLGLPLIGVGLLYRRGFFRQEIAQGHQRERFETIDPAAIGALDTGAVVDVPIGGRNVCARVWKQMVGTTQLLLLDTDIDTNTVADRQITDRLYSGDRRHRLDQELVLGVGGVRALRALGTNPAVFHLNEGHACFLLLELLAEQTEKRLTIDEAVEVVRSSTLFTTHTPVPAGIDRFSRALIRPELQPWAERLGIPVSVLLDWAHLPTDNKKRPFNTAAFAFELCGRANGVSQLHATVSEDLFSTLPRSKGIGGITNGVHARTWVNSELQTLYDETLGPRWDRGDSDAWKRAQDIDADRFRGIRNAGRRSLVDVVADRTGTKLDPEGCIIGFARRFATYKRAALLLRDRDGLEASLEAGAQFVFAGKAHPADAEGKAVLSDIAKFAESSDSRGQIVLVPDYDMAIAQTMYAGCDVWLNNPVRPREACGTSGEKAALNGGLNCSILDGWWADWYTEGIGWAIPSSDKVDPGERDDAEAAAMHRLLAQDVMKHFDEPDAWWATTVAMLTHLGPLVTAGRMVAEYDERFYAPILRK